MGCGWTVVGMSPCERRPWLEAKHHRQLQGVPESARMQNVSRLQHCRQKMNNQFQQVRGKICLGNGRAKTITRRCSVRLASSLLPTPSQKRFRGGLTRQGCGVERCRDGLTRQECGGVGWRS